MGIGDTTFSAPSVTGRTHISVGPKPTMLFSLATECDLWGFPPTQSTELAPPLGELVITRFFIGGLFPGCGRLSRTFPDIVRTEQSSYTPPCICWASETRLAGLSKEPDSYQRSDIGTGVISDGRLKTNKQDCADLFWIGGDKSIANHACNCSPAVQYLIVHHSQLGFRRSVGGETRNRSPEVGRLTTNEWKPTLLLASQMSFLPRYICLTT